MARLITYDNRSRQAILRGVNVLADAVKVTMCPKGRNVVIGTAFGSPTIGKDGVTVAREIDLPDPLENMGAQMVREVASKTSDVAGDGTTTATVLAQPIYREGVDIPRLREVPGDVARTQELPAEISGLRRTLGRTGRFGRIVGRSSAMRGACDLIARIAPSSASVLISGESGTGKEVVARTIHELSRRRHREFLPVNCGAISPTLMESELFGHERGSFTGADRRHKGCFERATRGTLFLDEITEMPTALQVKLLRVLETGTVLRVGGEAPVSVDVRILAASNRDVQKAVDTGQLREDLYYRIKVFHLPLAPLRERPEDVVPLVQSFLDDIASVEGVRKDCTDAALQVLSTYRWPGNVRELRNAVQSAWILADRSIDVDHLPGEVQLGAILPRPADDGDGVRVVAGTPLADVERQLIMATLRECAGNKTKAAEHLGVSVKTLYNRLHAYEDATQASQRVHADDASVDIHAPRQRPSKA